MNINNRNNNNIDSYNFQFHLVTNNNNKLH